MDEVFAQPALAIYAGDIAGLASMLAEDPEIATRASTVGHPMLLQLVACEADKIPNPVDAARVLVAAGAATALPLVAAAGCGSRTIVEFLLDEGTDVDVDALWTPLDEAIYWANPDIAALLLERGATIRALSTAAGLGSSLHLDAFFDGDDLTGDAGPIGSPFPDTVPEGLAHDRQALVDHAFVMAVNGGQRSCAESLLSRGAAVNAKPPGYHWHGTALHAAVWRGDGDLVAWLLSVGADPAIRDGLADSDAAGWASHHGHPELLELLT